MLSRPNLWLHMGCQEFWQTVRGTCFRKPFSNKGAACLLQPRVECIKHSIGEALVLALTEVCHNGKGEKTTHSAAFVFATAKQRRVKENGDKGRPSGSKHFPLHQTQPFVTRGWTKSCIALECFDFPVNTNRASKWCRISSIHSRGTTSFVTNGGQAGHEASKQWDTNKNALANGNNVYMIKKIIYVCYCLLHMESLVKCEMYPKSTPV